MSARWIRSSSRVGTCGQRRSNSWTAFDLYTRSTGAWVEGPVGRPLWLFSSCINAAGCERALEVEGKGPPLDPFVIAFKADPASQSEDPVRHLYKDGKFPEAAYRAESPVFCLHSSRIGGDSVPAMAARGQIYATNVHQDCGRGRHLGARVPGWLRWQQRRHLR